ncbi:hypothetical protein [Listeria grayi]|uniref:Uncharacterized protein n=1 Tax=Listeria grayi DSM 20601 TaxID=525367 RepID=D7UUF7_LISGR|nr:hypothetical protein [Listeria grayi]EFI85264.1 hypothetical protein HMPREF0556_10463 [Listeria grayi DSM 20601]
MENLEMIFEDIIISDIEKILSWMSFSEKNIKRSHFFMHGADKEYSDISSLSEYFKNAGTCNILVENLNIGIILREALIVISFDEKYGDLTLTFSEEYGELDEEKLSLVSERLHFLSSTINYSKILFGYEPADEEELQLLILKN